MCAPQSCPTTNNLQRRHCILHVLISAKTQYLSSRSSFTRTKRPKIRKTKEEKRRSRTRGKKAIRHMDTENSRPYPHRMIPQSTTLRSPLSTATTQESWAVCALVGAGSGFGAVRDTSTGRLPPRVLGLTTSPRPQPVSGDRRPASLLYTLVRGRGEEEEEEDSALKSFRPVRQDQPRLGRRRPMRAWQVFGCVGRAQNSGRIIPWWISCTMIESNENDRGWGGGRWSMFLIRICTTFHDSEWGWTGMGWTGALVGAGNHFGFRSCNSLESRTVNHCLDSLLSARVGGR
ncbi:hypothetical protein Mp_2g25580 [Marchantia polymorpha subsp. ruderalis]|uniref:Uncharacterized protein n=1 Tax=Marchantia polymorpha TaxID=3197 RepID=A0A2R6XBI0_MARPO|nr:hypothetical protein MARPO_0025s0119 [Marchantia polymorpha]BBN03694.1 hypothetical protein Mp_2g25580 [Marchantia polymorpha subsp. ruderalis]|eukprot:PTQ43437.1 hypothetical protein MARPO_0025s0119 [Marchantia polymorpha]